VLGWDAERRRWSAITDFFQGVLAGALPALAVSLLTAYVTVRLALKQFYAQRWWDKRAEAYSDLLRELGALSYTFGEQWDDALWIKRLSDEERVKLSNRYKDAREKLISASAGDSYALSADTEAEIAALLKELSKNDASGNWAVDIDRWHGAVNTSLGRIREHARSELKG
jgi:hypothetical protein